MAAALGEANAPPVAAPEEEETPRFSVGELVEVKPRTFPGMNKPGGTATISARPPIATSCRNSPTRLSIIC